jgi:hypothetical protein
VYTCGAEEAIGSGFRPLPGFPDLDRAYYSTELFPIFSNRLLPRSRPEYPAFVEWLSVSAAADTPFMLLARGGGQRVTDRFEVFPQPEMEPSGRYRIHFFVHGLRHLSTSSHDRAAQLTPGERLFLVHDFQNPWDPNALLLRTGEKQPGDVHLVGFCPRYLSQDVFEHGLTLRGSDPVVVVQRVNPPPAPIQFRVLCRLTISAENGYQPFSSWLYQPMANGLATASAESLKENHDA